MHRKAATRARRGSCGSTATTSTAGDAEFAAIGTSGFRATQTVGLSYGGREGVMAIADTSVLLAAASRGIGKTLIDETFN